MAAADGRRCDSFLVTSSFGLLVCFFFFPPLHPVTLMFWHFHLWSPITVEHIPWQQYNYCGGQLSPNWVFLTTSKPLNIRLFYNLIWKFISMKRMHGGNSDNKELNKIRKWWGQVVGARKQPYCLLSNHCHLHIRMVKPTQLNVRVAWLQSGNPQAIVCWLSL